MNKIDRMRQLAGIDVSHKEVKQLNESSMPAMEQDTEQAITVLGTYLENHMDYLDDELRMQVAGAYRALKEFRQDMREMD